MEGSGAQRPRVMPKTRTGKSQLAKLASAHKPSPRKQTPRKEDYAEIIYELIREKGYAKPVDIANHLHVTPPTVTEMLDRFVEYAKLNPEWWNQFQKEKRPGT